MADPVDVQHTGDPNVQVEVRSVVEHVLANRPGEWRVSMTGSQANERQELKITDGMGRPMHVSKINVARDEHRRFTVIPEELHTRHEPAEEKRLHDVVAAEKICR